MVDCPCVQGVDPPEVVQAAYGQYERMLLPPAPSSYSTEPYLGPKLNSNQKESPRRVCHLNHVGMLCHTAEPKCTIGLLCVDKDNEV